MIEIFADAPQAALTQLVQLVVLCIPLFILPMIIKNSSSMMSKIGNAADRTMKGLGIEKGLGKAQGGARGFAKQRALSTEMRAANLEGSDNRFGRVVGRAGGFRHRRAEKKAWADSERKRAQQHALNEYLDAGGDKDLAAERQARFAGAAASAGGADRVASWEAGQKKEIFGEAVKLEEAKLFSSSTAELTTEMEEAIRSGNAERAYAASSLLNQRGVPGTIAAGKVLSRVAENENFSSATSELASGIVRENGKEFNAVDPSLTRYADQTVGDRNARTLGEVSQDSTTYTSSSPEKMSTWSTETIQKAHAHAWFAGGTASANLREQSRALLTSRYAENLSPEQRAYHENIRNGNPP